MLWFNYGQCGSWCSNGQHGSIGQYGLVQKHIWKIRNTTKCLVRFLLRRCLCDNWKSSFLPLLVFDWCSFSRWVTAVGDVREQKIKYSTIRIREIGGVRLYVNRLYVKSINFLSQLLENITIMFLVVCV